MVRIHLFTLGYTAEFILKPLLEEGVGPDTYVAVLYVLGEDEYSRKRVSDAITYIEKLGMDAGFLNRLIFKQVQLRSTFSEMIHEVTSSVAEAIREVEMKSSSKINEAHIWLTGGMRILVVSTLIATKMLLEPLNMVVKYHVWSEDGSYKYVFDLLLLSINMKDLPKVRAEILKRIVSLNIATYEKLTDAKRTEATIRKIVEFLRKGGLITCERRGRRTYCKASELGRIVALLMDIIGEMR